MIGKISGRLDWRGPDHVLIDVRGVGYIVYVSDRTLAGMPGLGEAVSACIRTCWCARTFCSCSAFRRCWRRSGTSF
jgi:Holliday junction resolvasome RuvABC DNA-binding subunit